MTNTDGAFNNPSNALSITVHDAVPALFPITVPVGVEGTPINLFAVAGSVATGSKPLMFTWKVIDPNNSTTTTTHASTVAPASPSQPGYQYVNSDSFTFTPSIAGPYIITVTATDGAGASDSRTETFTIAHVPPVINSFTVPNTGTEGQPVGFSALASEPTTATLSYNWNVIDSASGATVATAIGASGSFVPYGGNFVVELTVRDNEGGSVSRSATVSVPAVAPTITSFNVPSSTTEGITSTLSASAADAYPGSAMTYLWQVSDPSGRATSLSGSSVQYTWPIPGAYTVRLTVRDFSGLQAVASAVVQAADVAPTVTKVGSLVSPLVAINTLTTRTDPTTSSLVDLSATASDALGAATTESWTITPPSGAPLVLIGSKVSFSPASAGTYQVSVTATSVNGAATATGVLTVTQGPVSIGSLSVGTNVSNPSTVVLSATATDAHGAAVGLTWTLTPTGGAPITLTGNAVSFTPAGDGTYSVSLAALSTSGLTNATAVLSIVNGQPSLGSIAGLQSVQPVLGSLAGLGIGQPTLGAFPTTGVEGKAIALGATATDSGNSQAPLQYIWTITPPNQGSPITLAGTFPSFTPPRAGNYQVQLVVSDSYGGSTAVNAGTIAVANIPPAWLGALQAPIGLSEGQTAQLAAPAVSTVPANQSTLQYHWTITMPTHGILTFTGRRSAFRSPAAAFMPSHWWRWIRRAGSRSHCRPLSPSLTSTRRLPLPPFHRWAT